MVGIVLGTVGPLFALLLVFQAGNATTSSTTTATDANTKEVNEDNESEKQSPEREQARTASIADLMAEFKEQASIYRILSEELVKKFVKYPHDADFGWFNTNVTVNNETHLCSVVGKVKALNAFGAKITHEWVVTYGYDRKAKGWKPIMIIIDDDTVFKLPLSDYQSIHVAGKTFEESNGPFSTNDATDGSMQRTSVVDGTTSYEVIDRTERIDGPIVGDVLISSYSQLTPVVETSRAAREIAENEEFDIVYLYSTRDAYKAAYSSSFSKANPNASSGYLGTYANGLFTPPENNDSSTDRADLVASSDSNDGRTHWFNESYNTTIYHVRDKEWAEKDNKTDKLKWAVVEKHRTAEYIELHNAERNQTWRIRDNRMELKKGNKWEWLSNGKWTK